MRMSWAETKGIVGVSTFDGYRCTVDAFLVVESGLGSPSMYVCT